MKKTDVIVVGAGLSGAATARVLAEKGKTVKILEKQNHIGGNAYDFIDGGILVHKYGPHIYHTNSDTAHAFLSRFCVFIPYKHRVLAKIDGREVPVPFNFTSLETLFPPADAQKLKTALVAQYGENIKIPIFELKNHADPAVRRFGEYVYEKVFYNYTVKQWGTKPEQLNPETMKRVPISIGYEDGYFTDKYQYMPKEGFTALIGNILKHKNIEVALNTDADKLIKIEDGKLYFEGRENSAAQFIYTGCLDKFFGYKYGALPYRTLDFKFETHGRSDYQSAAVVNYPNEERFTRISEFTKFTCPPQKNTVIVKEYPAAHIPDKTLPYYPIETPENNAVYAKYKSDAARVKNFFPLGRLGSYKYINMDTAVLSAITLAEGL